jgi:large subunit ribosomal protein LP1
MALSKAEHDELCCVYAGLLLFDDKIDITADKLNKVIAASGNQVDAYYPEFFGKYLASIDLNGLLTNISSGAAAGGSAPAQEEKKDDKAAEKGKPAGKDAGKGGEKGKAPPKEAPKEEPEEEAGGFGDLFG